VGSPACSFKDNYKQHQVLQGLEINKRKKFKNQNNFSKTFIQQACHILTISLLEATNLTCHLSGQRSDSTSRHGLGTVSYSVSIRLKESS
jgi:hypothetical protein